MFTAKVYSELLRDLQAFVADRVGGAVHLNIPKLYHGGGGEWGRKEEPRLPYAT